MVGAVVQVGVDGRADAAAVDVVDHGRVGVPYPAHRPLHGGH
jgi:hypothetical protein